MKNQTPRLDAKTVNANPHTGTGKQVSVVADMRFTGVASLNQVGAQFWSGETGEARSKGPTARGSWRGGSQSPSPPARGLGERCKLPQRIPRWSPGRWKFFLHSVPPD